MDITRDLLSLPVRQAIERVKAEAYADGYKDGYNLGVTDGYTIVVEDSS